jgi:hypothetical protein
VAIKHSPGCGCCCKTTELYPEGGWYEWSDPPPEDDEGVIASGHTTSIIHPRPTGNWVVDIQIINTKSGNNTIVKVGDLEVEIDTVSSNHSIQLKLSTCPTYARSSGFWLRFMEATITGDPVIRRKRIEVWSADPKSSTSTLVGHACVDLEKEDDEYGYGYGYGGYTPPEEVEVTLTAGTQEITIGTVRISGTEQDESSCPPVECTVITCSEGGSADYINEQAFLSYTDWPILKGRYRYTGDLTYGGVVETDVDVYVDFEWDLTLINGSHLMLPINYTTGNAISDSEMEDAIERIKQRGYVSPCHVEWNYGWRAPFVSLIGTYSYSLGPDTALGYNFFPREYHTTNTATLLNKPTSRFPGNVTLGPTPLRLEFFLSEGFRIRFETSRDLFDPPGNLQDIPGFGQYVRDLATSERYQGSGAKTPWVPLVACGDAEDDTPFSVRTILGDTLSPVLEDPVVMDDRTETITTVKYAL